MTQPQPYPSQHNTEWQTWLLIVSVCIIWLGLVLHYSKLPGAALLLVLTNALDGSVQHELTHGHPTRHVWLNSLLAYAPLSIQAQRSELIHENGGFVVKGYRQWWTKNLFKAVDHPRHPFDSIIFRR